MTGEQGYFYKLKGGNFIMIKIKKINNKLGAPGDKKNKNPFLKTDGGIDLIEKFPVYKSKRKRKTKR